MPKVLTLLHTTPVVVGLIGSLAKEILPGGTVIRHYVDDSLLNDTRAAGHLTKDVVRRMVGHVQHAEAYGSDCVLFTCSSVGPAVDVARLVVNIPVLKIDEPMAEEAVRRGTRIAVLATLATTLGPTKELIQQKDPGATVDTILCSDAFDALARGDGQLHNRLLIGQITCAAAAYDVVVLAQASMTNILPDLPVEVVPRVLTSPRLGLIRTAEVLRGL